MKIDNIVIENRTRKHLGNIQELADSIKLVGLLHPIVVTPNNHLIAGYRRIEAYKLLGKNEIPHTIVNSLDGLLKILAEQHENTCRLDFTPSEAVEIGKMVEPLERKEAKERQGTRTDIQLPEKFSGSNALDKVAIITGLSRPTYSKAKQVVEAAEQKPELKYIVEEMDETGKVDRAFKELKRVKRLEERQSTQIDIPVDSPVWHGDFRTVGNQIPDNSVDMIFTDPPYNEDAIQLYRDLGIFANRVLKPGGLLLTYSGQIFLPQTINALSENLEYIWCFSTRHNEGQTRIWKVNVKNTWKPILGYIKPPLDVWWKSIPDSVIGKSDKSSHDWQQNIEDALHYLSHLCPSSGLVVDPFCGSGTTLVAAKQLGIRHIGIEEDIEDVQSTIKRLNDKYT